MRISAVVLVAIGLTQGAFAASSVKDIVLDRVATPAQSTGNAPSSDAMAVSVLVEGVDGSMMPRSTQSLFRTGERFRIKVVASRAGKLSLYNTNPLGLTGRDPVWTGMVNVGQETISPRLRLDGNSGEDQLHVLLEPADQPQGALVWLNSWLLNKSASKDISLDVQSTPATSYVINRDGQGLVTTVRIVHTR
jgi:hypothetical protein